MDVNTNFTLIEKVYSFLLRNRISNKNELEAFANNEMKKDFNYLYRNFIFKLMKQGKVGRIRKNLYYANNIYTNENVAINKYLLGSKILKEYYLGYHTALEVFGCAQSAHNGCYIVSNGNSRFNSFSFENYTFTPVVVNDVKSEIIKRITDDNTVNVSSPSRTFVECIHRPDLCIGYEEVYKSLDSLGGVTIDSVISVLKMYGIDRLSRSVGFFLEELASRSPYYSHIEHKDLNRIQDMIGHSRTYLIRGQSGGYDGKWRMYIPEDLRDLFLGVR